MKTIKIVVILIFSAISFAAFSANCSLNAGVDQVVCTGTATLTGDFSGSFPVPKVTVWSQVSGPSATITTPSALVTTVTGLVGGNTYKFRLSSTCEDGSATYDEVSITVSNFPTTNAGADFTICTGNTVGPLAATALQVGETGLWTIVSGGNGLTINTPTSPTSTIKLTAGANNSGAAVLRWTVTNTATSCTAFDDVTVTKISAAPVNAGIDQTLTTCYNSTATCTLAGSYAGGGTGGSAGTWTVVTGPNVPTIANVNTYNSSVTNLIQGVYIFRWTVAGPCVSGSDDVQITVNAPVGSVSTATASISGSPTMPYCVAPSSIVLLGSAYNANTESVQWTKTAGPAGVNIATPTSQNTVVTGFDNITTTTFTYKITNNTTGCTSTSGVVSVSFEAGQSLAITTASPYVLDCNITSATINITQTGSTTPQWSVVSGPTGLTGYANISGSSFTATGLTLAGTYLIRVKKTVGNCTTIYDEINVVVSKSPTASNAGSDQTLACNVNTGELIGNTPTIGSGKWSQLSGPNIATLAAPTTPRCGISGLISGVYQFRWTISAGPKCPTTQDEVFVRIASTTPTTANAGPDQTICNSTPLYLEGNTPLAFETGTWSVSPSTGVVFSNINSPTAVVTGLASSSTYTFTWRIANSCGTSSDNVVVTTSATVGPIASNAGANQCLAAGTTTVTLAGNNPSPGTGLWRKLSGGSAVITNPNLYNTTVTGLADGTYTFEWAITRNECTTTRDTVTVTISATATTANAGADQLTICGTTTSLQGNTAIVGNGVWTQIAGSGGVSITNPTSPTTTLTGLTDGQYIFRWTISNNACSSTSDDVVLFVSSSPTVPNAGLDKIVCGTTSTTMTANTITVGTGFWNIVSGPNAPTITTISSPVTTVTGLITGEPYVLTWNSNNGLCNVLTDTVKITVVPAANAGLSQTICGSVTVSLTGNANTTGVWTQDNPAQTTEIITSTNSYSAVASNLIPNTKYRFRYTLSDAQGCGAVTDTMTVDVKSSPNAAIAGTDMNTCIDVASTTLNMSANTPDNGTTGKWAKVSGPTCTITNVSSPTTSITGVTPGIYTFSWTISNGACASVDQVVARVSSVVAKSAGADQAICGTSTTMAAQAAASGVGTWTQTSGPNTATIASAVSNTTAITGLIPGTYVFRWTITDGTCTGVFDEMNLVVSSAPTTPNAGNDQNVCNASAFTLAGNTISNGTGSWSKISGPTCTITNVNSPTSTVTGTTPGTYVFQWTASNGSCADLTDQVTIVNYNAPTQADAGVDFNACLYAPLNLSANTPVYGTGTWSQVSGTTVSFTNPNSPTTAITGALAGTYTFRWSIANGNCIVSNDDVVVTIDQPATIADAGPNQSVSTNYTTMAANAIAVGTGMWTKISGPAGGVITTPTSPTTTVTGLLAGTYVYRWTATNISCSSFDEVTIIYDGISCVISNKMIQHKLQ